MESIFLQILAEAEKECKKREIEMDQNADRSVLNRQLKDLLAPKNHLKQLIRKHRFFDFLSVFLCLTWMYPFKAVYVIFIVRVLGFICYVIYFADNGLECNWKI